MAEFFSVDYLFHLIGYAVLLFVGARIQNAKAVYPDPSVVEAHLRKNPKVFHETFEALFPKAEQLPFWGEFFPDWFKEQNGNLCEIETGSDLLSFHTLDDLKKLSCDAELRKIIKVLGSKDFLEKVLSQPVLDNMFAHAVSDENSKLKIFFRPYYSNVFFNVLGKGSLYMDIDLWDDDKEEENKLNCSFTFDFEKKKSVTVLKNCTVSYRAGNGKIEMDFLKKTNELPGFPWNAVGEARKKFSSMYAKLRDDFKKGRKKYECCKICRETKAWKFTFESRLKIYSDLSYITEAEKVLGVRNTELQKKSKLP